MVVTPLHLRHRRRPTRDARDDRRRLDRGAVRRHPRRRCAWTGRSRSTPGCPSRRCYEELRALAARNVSTEDEISFLGGGHVRPLRAGADRLDHPALGVPDAVHALPARDLAGRAAGDVRVPDGDLRADRAAGLERVGVRGPERGRRRRLRREARQRPHAGSWSPAACTRTRARRCATLAHAWGMEVVEAPLGDGVTAAARARRRRQRGDRRSSRTSSARSRTSSALARRRARRRRARRSARATRCRSRCSRRPASAASTSPSARARRSATGSTSAARRSASSPPPRR